MNLGPERTTSACAMYLSHFLLHLVTLLFVIHATNSEEQDDEWWRKQLSDIANLQMINDTTEILNLKTVVQRYAIPYMRDCDEMFQAGHTESGLYILRPEKTRKLVAQCYMDGCDGWTVIQHNTYDTEIVWSESWKTYKFGFGNLEGDHWLGNEYISFITQQKWYKVRIVLTDAKGHRRYAEYDSFVLRNETDGYRVELGKYEGNAGDPLTSSLTKNMHDNMRFSAKDRDNDRSTKVNCADIHGGGWWYDSCYNAQLNHNGGLYWSTLCDGDCRKSVIMVKPVHMHCHRV